MVKWIKFKRLKYSLSVDLVIVIFVRHPNSLYILFSVNKRFILFLSKSRNLKFFFPSFNVFRRSVFISDLCLFVLQLGSQRLFERRSWDFRRATSSASASISTFLRYRSLSMASPSKDSFVTSTSMECSFQPSVCLLKSGQIQQQV